MTSRRRLRPFRAGPVGEPVGSDALLVAAGCGDLAAFAAFYDATAPQVTGLMRAVVVGPDRSDALIEEVYLAVWRDAPRFNPDLRSAEATLRRLVWQALIGMVRRRRLGQATDEPGAARESGRPHHLRQENAQ